MKHSDDVRRINFGGLIYAEKYGCDVNLAFVCKLCFEHLPSSAANLCVTIFCYVVTGIDWALKYVFKV